MLTSEFAKKTFEECYATYRHSPDPAIRVVALCEMMNKAATRAELEIVRSLTHPNSDTHARAKERLELLETVDLLQKED